MLNYALSKHCGKWAFVCRPVVSTNKVFASSKKANKHYKISVPFSKYFTLKKNSFSFVVKPNFSKLLRLDYDQGITKH